MVKRMLILVLVAGCIAAVVASIPVSNASAMEAEAAYGGCWVKRCTTFEPCTGYDNLVDDCDTLSYEFCPPGTQPGANCGHERLPAEQGQEDAWKCYNYWEWSWSKAYDACYFAPAHYRDFGVYECECDQALDCVDTEVYYGCGNHPYKCYTYPNPP